MCMNAYLGLAMTTAAAIDGVTEKIDAGKPLDQDLYTLSEEELEKRGIRRLPSHLLEAVESSTRAPSPWMSSAR